MAIINNVLSLDIGSSRIGVAIASFIAKIPRPLTTLNNDYNFFQELKSIIEAEDIQILVVGLPRGLDGQNTKQTKETEDFIGEIKKRIDLPLYVQDEALTSKKAEDELRNTGKPYNKGDIDALAAAYILNDFLLEKASKIDMENQ